MATKAKKMTIIEFNSKFVDRKVKLINNTSGGDPRAVGKFVTILRTIPGSGNMTPTHQIYIQEYSGYYYFRDFDWKLEETIEEFEKSIKDLESEKENINSEINSIKLKIEFMKDNKLKEFDEDTFKAFAILKELKKATSDISKAKLISKIIKG